MGQHKRAPYEVRVAQAIERDAKLAEKKLLELIAKQKAMSKECRERRIKNTQIITACIGLSASSIEKQLSSFAKYATADVPRSYGPRTIQARRKIMK